MAFSSRRGRPRNTPRETIDPGTPELQRKLASGITHEPIDRCLGKGIISVAQHQCGLHLRWLYTLRYGAPVLTTHYVTLQERHAAANACENWRAMREQEYRDAGDLLRRHRRYEPVMRLVVYNEVPAFLEQSLVQRAWRDHAMAEQLYIQRTRLCEGLELLVAHWRRGAN